MLDRNSITYRINDLIWNIETVDESSDHLKIDDPNSSFDSAYGITDAENLTIYLQREKLDSQLYMRYMIHELTHAYILSYGIDADNMKEEDICLFMQSHATNIVMDAIKILEKFGYKSKLVS